MFVEYSLREVVLINNIILTKFPYSKSADPKWFPLTN